MVSLVVSHIWNGTKRILRIECIYKSYENVQNKHVRPCKGSIAVRCY